MAVSEDKQYEYIAGVVNNRLEYTRDALKLYIQTFTVIVGGSIWLNTQSGINSALKWKYILLSNAIVFLVFFVTAAMVFEALRSWYRFRQKMSEFDAAPYSIPAPKFPWLGAETVMLLGMLGSAVLFFCYNPFSF